MTTAKSKTPAAAKAVSDDVDAIAPVPGEITLSSGTVVRVSRLRTRELFKLLKIVTTGAAYLLPQLDFDMSDREKFAGQMVGLIFTAIPEAEDEAIDFILAMVSPVDLIEKPKTKEQRASNEAKILALNEELQYNPEIMDTFSIIETVIATESDDLLALGKRLGAMFKMNVAQNAVNSSSSNS